jgi:hypothetical protein
LVILPVSPSTSTDNSNAFKMSCRAPRSWQAARQASTGERLEVQDSRGAVLEGKTFALGEIALQ